MKKQPDINDSMRSILVDWLVEVSEEYRLQSETLFLAVNYIDRFLSFMSVVRAKLQLVGTAAMFISSWVVVRFSLGSVTLKFLPLQEIRRNLSSRDWRIRLHHWRHLHEAASFAHGETAVEGSLVRFVCSIGSQLHQPLLMHDEYSGKGSIYG